MHFYSYEACSDGATGGLGALSSHPTSGQDQFSNSSKCDDKMLGLGRGTSNMILNWAWQPNHVAILGRDIKIPPRP